MPNSLQLDVAIAQVLVHLRELRELRAEFRRARGGRVRPSPKRGVVIVITPAMRRRHALRRRKKGAA